MAWAIGSARKSLPLRDQSSPLTAEGVAFVQDASVAGIPYYARDCTIERDDYLFPLQKGRAYRVQTG